jgi:HPt (histidine-containing phosphotransfer) domain-containing protein
MTGGDAELAAEVLGIFMGQITRLQGTFSAPLQGSELADAAHALKGAALGVGANALASACAGVEVAARSGTGDADTHLQAVISLMAPTREDAQRLAQELAERGVAAFSSPVA